MTNAPSDRHPDHARGFSINNRLPVFWQDLAKIDTNQEVWRPKAIYHYIQFNNLTPDYCCLIYHRILDQMLSHWPLKNINTQFFDPDSKESDTIISSQGISR